MARTTGQGEDVSGLIEALGGDVSADAMDLADTDAARPVSLGHVVKTLTADRSRSPTAIHWIVRQEQAPEDLSGLDCQYPPRLRNAQVDDGDESMNVPLSERQPLTEPQLVTPDPLPLSHIGLGPSPEWPGVRRRANTR